MAEVANQYSPPLASNLNYQLQIKNLSNYKLLAILNWYLILVYLCKLFNM